MKRTILTLAGVRPNYTRLAPLIRLIDSDMSGKMNHVFVHTGQHYNSSLYSDLLRTLGIRQPDFDLGIGVVSNKNPHTQIPLLLEKILGVIERVRPDVVVMTGDTNTVLASVIVSRCHVPIVHIEAGLRSYDWRMPEEKNRIIVDHLADMLHCYLPYHRDILLSEGIDERRISVVGNVITDTLKLYASQIEQSQILTQLGIQEKNFFLCTLHREETTSTREIFESKLVTVREAARNYKMPVVFPLMPRTVHALENFGLQPLLESSVFITTEPLSFFDFAKLEKTARLIISDSGTVQEEALIFGTPLVIARRSTERPEVLFVKSALLEGMESKESLTSTIHKGMEMPLMWDRDALNPQGGSPSARIMEDIIEKLRDNFFHSSRDRDFVIKSNASAQAAYGIDI